jgi:hypothetical protein
MLATGGYALPGLASPLFADGRVILGLPFFYGRAVYTAIEGHGTPSGPGPYIGVDAQLPL